MKAPCGKADFQIGVRIYSEKFFFVSDRDLLAAVARCHRAWACSTSYRPGEFRDKGAEHSCECPHDRQDREENYDDCKR